MLRPMVCGAVALLLLPGGLGRTGAQETEPPVFGTDVSVVMLPIFVVDRDGRAVRGLQPEDFVVEEDGDEVEVVSFLYVDTTSEEEADDIRLASAARRRFLLLFDKSFTHPAGLHRAQNAAADFVRHRLAPSDLAAVATFDVRRGIRLVANFTEDRALLAHAVESLGVPQLTQISDPLGLAADLAVTDIEAPGGDQEGAIPQVLLDNVLGVLVRQMRSAEEQEYKNNIEMLIGSLHDLATGLRQVDGRKQIVYLSAGFDARLLVGQWGGEQKAAGESLARGRLWEVDGRTRYGDTTLRDGLAEVTEDLARADAVVHTIDVTGLGEDGSLEQVGVTQDISRSTTNRESLSYVSAETGGRFFRDANNLEPALAEMLEMTSRYYVLGFQPERQEGPGSYHKIKVKVARRKVELSHRKGYFERGPSVGRTVLQQQFDAAQLVMTGVGDDDIEFASICLPFPTPTERQTLGLVLQVPKESLPWESGAETALEVYGYAVAEDGSVEDHLAQFARVDPARADPEGTMRGLSFFGTLSVPPGRYTIRLMVREGDSGTSGIQFLDVTVPPHDPDVAFLLPPVVTDEPREWLGIGLGAGKQGGEGAAYPFLAGDEAFLPRASFEVTPGRTERIVLLAYEPAVQGDPATDLEIRSSLAARDGTLVPGGRLRMKHVHREDDGRRAYVFSYTAADIEEGDYTLRIGVGEGGALVEAYTLLRVRSAS